jgi:AbrB family looped-hinge helix DNA binding protein
MSLSIESTRETTREITRLSTKGQIVLPKSIRDSRAWRPGTEFVVEETGEGILLRPAARFPATELKEVAGCLRSRGRSKTLTQMRAAVDLEMRRRHEQRSITSVLVRLLTGDEPRQATAARSVFASGPVWIGKTVLLETGWILRSLYGFEANAIRDALTKLLGLRNVHAEDESSIAAALALTAHGIELADAMHLTSRPPGAAFVSFDEAFVRCAGRAGVAEIS